MNSDDRVPSPEATGGAGGSFETRTVAVAFARLLRCDRIPGLDGPPIRLRLQQRVAGAAFDDLVLDAADPRGGEQNLEYQIRRRQRLTAKDPDFVELIGLAVGQLRSNPDPIVNQRRRFGLASKPTTALDNLQRIASSARFHDHPASFVNSIRASASKDAVSRLAELRAAVATARPDDK